MSAYREKCKEGIKRVQDLTEEYRQAQEAKDYGLAAVIRGQLSAAQAYLQGVVDAGEVLLNAGHDVMGGDR